MLWVQFSHTDHWMFNMAPHGKELSEDFRIRIVALHKDGRGYKKFGNSLELSYSTVASVIQRFSKTGFTRNRPRKGRSKKLIPCAVRQVQKLASKNRCMSAASIALEQWFSTFFSTGPHYGPSASLTGRTHVIYILRHQFKPTRFIILFIA